MKTLTLYIGHNVDGRPVHNQQAICRHIEHVLEVTDYTVVEGIGKWQGETEKTSICIISGLEEAEAQRIYNLVPALSKALKQQGIFAEQREVAAEFVPASKETDQKTA